MGEGGGSSMSTAELQAQEGAEVPEPAAAEGPSDSEGEAELAQLMRQMGVSDAAAGAWGAAQASAAASASAPAGGAGPALSSPPASPAQQQLVGGAGVSAAASAAGSSGIIAAAALEPLLDELMCPITQEPMRDPVLAADGSTYEHAAIEAWIVLERGAGRAPTSPMTGAPLEHLHLAPNRALRSMAERVPTLGLLLQVGVDTQSSRSQSVKRRLAEGSSRSMCR